MSVLLKKKSLLELNRPSLIEFAEIQKIGLSFYADNIRSGHNIGSLFRIADAFKMESIFLSEYCVKPPHPEIEKTALGSTKSVPWISVNSDLDFLITKISENYRLIGIEQTENSIPLQNFIVDQSQKYIIILGNEVNGIQQQLLELVDVCIEIPQFGTKHSLNVSVAAGIVAWHFAKEWF